MTVEPGLWATLHRTVTEDDTARALGSGDLEVLATPRLLAWCEAATVAAVADRLGTSDRPGGPVAPPPTTTVGTRAEVEHLRASPVGTAVDVLAELVHVDGRLLRFDAAVTDGGGVLVGRATVTRVVVDRERFLSRL